MRDIDMNPAIREIVEVLHKHKIPISLVRFLFDEARKYIEDITIPANPKGGDANVK